MSDTCSDERKQQGSHTMLAEDAGITPLQIQMLKLIRHHRDVVLFPGDVISHHPTQVTSGSCKMNCISYRSISANENESF